PARPAVRAVHGHRRPVAAATAGGCAVSGERYRDMLAAVEAFHAKHGFREKGGEDLPYRVALMAEELGEISACVTTGKGRDALAEECADLLILVIGTAVSAGFD